MQQRQIDALASRKATLAIVRELSNLSLVRPKLEYACVAWEPYKKISQFLTKVQRKAARFVKQDYSKYISVTRMIYEHAWNKLQYRLKDIGLTIYAIQHDY